MSNADQPGFNTLPASTRFGNDAFDSFAPLSPAAAAVKPPAAPTANDDFSGFGGFASPPAAAATVVPPAASVAGDDFGGFGDFDSFSSAATTAPNVPNMPPGAQLGTAGKSGSLDPSPTPAAASSSWVAKLPNLAFVLNEKLDRPSM
jgi:hypothetical protein